ncbi:hypothetical protein F2981_10205 [Sinorhizobium meliloti]|nr:hypothetical protein [Sinorhizobium meliloti]
MTAALLRANGIEIYSDREIETLVARVGDARQRSWGIALKITPLLLSGRNLSLLQRICPSALNVD